MRRGGNDAKTSQSPDIESWLKKRKPDGNPFNSIKRPCRGDSQLLIKTFHEGQNVESRRASSIRHLIINDFPRLREARKGIGQ